MLLKVLLITAVVDGFEGFFLADETLPKDEIDELFEKLQPIEPPPLLIQRILTSISRLSRPTTSRPPPDLWNEVVEIIDTVDSPVMRKENLPPS